MNHPPLLLHRRRGPAGFTLMEMLLVLSIIALLMGIVIYKMVPFAEQAKEQRVAADLLGFKELLAAYELQTGSLPTTEQGLSVLWAKPTVEPVPRHWRALLESPSLDPWNHPYQYRNPGRHNPERYDLFSMGPDGLPDTADDIGNWTTTTASTP